MGGAGAIRCRAPARAPISLLLLARARTGCRSVHERAVNALMDWRSRGAPMGSSRTAQGYQGLHDGSLVYRIAGHVDAHVFAGSSHSGRGPCGRPNRRSELELVQGDDPRISTLDSL